MSAVRHAASLDEAVQLLGELGEAAGVVGGATWVMRDWTRGTANHDTYISLARVPGLDAIAHDGDRLTVGAAATHAGIGAAIAADHPAGALGEAARTSAFPAVRNVATIAGNIGADPFPEADLVPALIALDAEILLLDATGERAVAVADYVAGRRAHAGALIRAVRVPAPPSRRSGYARQIVRGGAEYPLAAVAVAVDLGPDGEVARARVAVGAVEEHARRVPEAEAALAGRRLDEAAARHAGAQAAEVLAARDAHDAPGWYRLAVLPGLFARATTTLREDA